MPFQTPITIRKALDRVHHHEFVLPAIQREFVWEPEQICNLFDSLMKGYPIGSFLFWSVGRETVAKYKYYDFMLDYHERDNPHCKPLSLPPGQPVVAVLDGQQRLTALNIGFRGSLAVKEKHKWWNSPHAFPTKRLYLNLLDEDDDNEPMFAFLTEDRAAIRDHAHAWFRVADIEAMESGAGIFRYVLEHGLNEREQPFQLLERLHAVAHKDGVIAYYDEDNQDLDRVLHIFIRTNSGGTKLSYSDLLLSIATAQWTKRDARKEIHGLVDDLNRVRHGFAFSQDFVLKAGLMLADVSSVGFKVTNFTRDNMELLENQWPAISKALRVAVGLAADFGFSAPSLSADSALLPLAYFARRHELDDGFRTHSAHAPDREAIRRWLVRSLVKSGVWGSGLDTLLTAIREVIRDSADESFPGAAIESRMAQRGKSLRFDAEEIDDLVDSGYGDRRVFPLLTLLYPHVDLRNEFHVDHVFPRSRFTETRLQRAGVAIDHVAEYLSGVNRLPNLQLLDASENKSKQDKMPGDWLVDHCPSPTVRQGLCDRNDLGDVGSTITAFPAFYEARRARLVHRVTELLGSVLAAT